jgi:hypothetical protein
MHFFRVDYLGEVPPSTDPCVARTTLFTLRAVPKVSPRYKPLEPAH